MGTVTALCPKLGYEKSAQIAKKSLATGTPIRQLATDEFGIDSATLSLLLAPRAMTQPAQ